MKVSVVKDVFKNLFKRPMTVLFPAEKIDIPPRNRAKHTFDIDTCKSCSLCANICPNKAIEMVEVNDDKLKEKYPKKYPQIDLGKCCFCALCQDICPTGSLKLSTDFYLATFDKNDTFVRPVSTDEAKN